MNLPCFFLKLTRHMVFMPLIFISILKLLLVYIPLFSEKGSEVVNPKKKKKKSKTNIFLKRPKPGSKK